MKIEILLGWGASLVTGAFMKAEGESGHRLRKHRGISHYVILEAEVGVMLRSYGRRDHTYQHSAFWFQAFRMLRQVSVVFSHPVRGLFCYSSLGTLIPTNVWNPGEKSKLEIQV